MVKELGFDISQPVSIWNKPLNINYGDLFKNLSKAVVSGVTGGWFDAIKHANESVSAIKFKEEPAQLAWLLIHRSLVQAIYELVQDNVELLMSRPQDFDRLCGTLDFSFETTEIRIDRSFFERPGELLLIAAIRTPLSQWLIEFGMTQSQAESVTGHLRSYFVFALNDQWVSHQSEYAPIKEYVDTPFTRAGEKEQEWNRYGAWLEKQANERMFYEAFGLRDVYLPLRAYYEQHNTTTTTTTRRIRPNTKAKISKIIVDLETALQDWLDKGVRGDAIRVISGGPGSGKSSFAKVFAATQAQRGRIRVLYVPLNLFDIKDDIPTAMNRFIVSDKYLTHNPLDSINQTILLIIFDGLDELAMQGIDGEKVTQDFINEIRSYVDRENNQQTSLQVILCGRELTVQTHASSFRKPAQILHLVPFFVSAVDKKEYDDPNDLLEEDQRQKWWELYGIARGTPYTGMPEELGKDWLNSITREPLLNYLVAQSYIKKQVDFTLEKQGNRNTIYEGLLKGVYARVWTDRQYPPIANIEPDQFIDVLEEIAVVAWHEDQLITTVKLIEKQCEISGLKDVLEKLQANAREGVIRLLTAFYFRQCETKMDGENTFQFTHRSFLEYLVARRIVGTLRTISDEIERRVADRRTGWDELYSLERWAALCGLTPLNEYLLRFVIGELLKYDARVVAKWQQTLGKLIGTVLQDGMPMQNRGLTSYKEEKRQARNAEESLLALLSMCADITYVRSTVEWPSTTSFGSWLSGLQTQRIGQSNTIAFESLSSMILDKCTLHMRDLFKADMHGSSMRKAGLKMAVLARCDLREVDLTDADLTEANLTGANLTKAILERANLQGACLRDVQLIKANLLQAKLENANLEMAVLENANFTRANLKGAILRGAYIVGACFNNADLRNADLEGAIMEGATFLDADLSGAILVDGTKAKKRSGRPR